MDEDEIQEYEEYCHQQDCDNEQGYIYCERCDAYDCDNCDDEECECTCVDTDSEEYGDWD